MGKRLQQIESFFPYFANNYLTSSRMTSMYYGHDMNDVLTSPFNSFAKLSQQYLNTALFPYFNTGTDNFVSAHLTLLERMTHQYAKPLWNLKDIVTPTGQSIQITPQPVMTKDFCTLIHFEKTMENRVYENDQEPIVLIAAPYSGHYATLLRDTVQTMLGHHDVYITDWINARDVPLSKGDFNFDDYVQYLLDFLVYFDQPIHIVAVCQPAVPVLALTALLGQDNSPLCPRSITLMGGPIDTRYTPTEVNNFARRNSIAWFDDNIIGHVPPYHAGGLRRVVPGFVLLAGFVNLKLEKHLHAPYEIFELLVKGDKSSAEVRKKFYDEYRAVLDLPADYYLDSIRMVFQEFLLPRGKMCIKGQKVDLKAITKTALLTIEGEFDDISGRGQTYAAHALCANLSQSMQQHYTQPGVGHYGIFNGHRWREQIYPQIKKFIAKSK